MNAVIYKPSNEILRTYIDYFLFLKNDRKEGFYKTFPNTNLCLALYRKNNVSWNRESNLCSVTGAGKTCNKLFGFHKKPFSVSYEGKIDQVCILFKSEGLMFFSKSPVNTIDVNDNPFEQIFGRDSDLFIERLFSCEDEKNQVRLLEIFLIKKIRSQYREKAMLVWALNHLKEECGGEKNIVSNLAGKININPSTLYRKFLISFGQSPYEIYKTSRFRKALYALRAKEKILTHVAYNTGFYDQAHFIKEIKQFTGETPGMLLKKLSEVQDTLLWLRN